MIDVERTVYKNAVDKLNKLRFQAQDDPKGFKSVLKLIIYNDMIEWSESLDTPHHIIKKLVDKRNGLLLHNSCIKPEYIDTSRSYVNVNTVQSSDTWKRIWDVSDNENYIEVTAPITEDEKLSCILWGSFKEYK
jgi:hypothetical protein